MNKTNTIMRASRLGLAAAALATGTMLAGGVSPASAGPLLCSPTPKPAFSVDNAVGIEFEGSLNVRVRLSRPPCTSVKVHFATAPDNPLSAKEFLDYIPTSIDVTIPAKATSAIVKITLVGGFPNEASGETFRVRLTNPVGGTILDGDGIVQIHEELPPL